MGIDKETMQLRFLDMLAGFHEHVAQEADLSDEDILGQPGDFESEEAAQVALKQWRLDYSESYAETTYRLYNEGAQEVWPDGYEMTSFDVRAAITNYVNNKVLPYLLGDLELPPGRF
jgi:hypothetical protein